MKDPDTLLIFSLIHDLKLPLAVIDLGTRSILSGADQLEVHQIGILKKIHRDNNQAKHFTNRILDAATVKSPVRSLIDIASEKAVLKYLKKALQRLNSAEGSLEQILNSLESIVSGIRDQIHDLKASFDPEIEMQIKHERIVDRLSRNARIALRLVEQAKMLFSEEVRVSPSRVSTSEIVAQPLIEVFDLKGESISEQLRVATTYDEVKTICSKAGIDLNIDKQIWDQICNLDQDRISQILVNLLLNSLKFRRNRTGISASREMDRLVVSVFDDGEGVSLLEKSQQVDLKRLASVEDLPVRGHGIGLVGVQAILKQMKGRLTVEPIEGQGASFTVTIPGVF